MHGQCDARLPVTFPAAQHHRPSVQIENYTRRLVGNQTAICSSGLPLDSIYPRNPYYYTDYYLFTDPEGMEG